MRIPPRFNSHRREVLSRHRWVRQTSLGVLLILLVAFTSACGHETDSGPAVGTATKGSPEYPETFGFGREATPEEIQAWDIDVMPDGTGLPPGSGTVGEGATIYANKCAACHGPTGTEGPNDRLVGREQSEGFPFGTDVELLEQRTIGTYWPYATTLYDYIYRTMPQNAPGSLTPEEVYSITAFLLHANEIIPEDAVMSAETLPQVEMPARDRFVRDSRRGGNEIR